MLLVSILLLVSAGIVILASKWSDYLSQPDPTPSTSLSASTTTEAVTTPSETTAADETLVTETLTSLPLDEPERQEAMGDLYVPLPEEDSVPERFSEPVRGLYIGYAQPFNADHAEAYADYVSQLYEGLTPQEPEANLTEKAVGLALASDVNALVIDIKGDSGDFSWKSDITAVSDIGADSYGNWVTYDTLLSYMRENGIHSIARIVSFKDPYLASQLPEHAIQLKEGGVYRDGGGDSWVNPFDPFVQDYAIAAAMEAALRGFDEVQFDYVRFPDNAAYYNEITDFPYRDDRDKSLAIEEFLIKARETLAPYGVEIGADVFGISTSTWNSQPEDIGQTWRLIANQVGNICPMIYPSHYSAGWYDLEYPDAEPAAVVTAAVREAIERNAAQPDPGVIRPWYQAFSAPWVSGSITYGPEEIKAQITAGFDLGIDEYLLWNANAEYDPMIFTYDETIGRLTEDPELDTLGRSPQEALNLYLEGLSSPYYPTMYLLEKRSDREHRYSDFRELWADNGVFLGAWTVNTSEPGEDGIWLSQVTCSFMREEIVLPQVTILFTIERESGVWHVDWPEGQHYTDLFETWRELWETTEVEHSDDSTSS